MTFSLIARDPQTGDFGAAVATGGPCAGGYVLHAMPGVGAIATQGLYTNTLYGPHGLRMLEAGAAADAVVAALTARDGGSAYRQLIVLDREGRSAGWTGAHNVGAMAHECATDLALAGNYLHSAALIPAMRDAFRTHTGSLVERLLAALAASRAVGGDSRGEWSAAVRVVSMDRAPLDLRVDYDAAPITRLHEIHTQVQQADFQRFLRSIPVPNAPDRAGEFT
ncbi:DUF1028 domain-containing protein [Acidihalobacter ferrooxydans]|uniref:Fimbrial assembly protein FimA n=1 Tax=Acidihalobacter ferrooxydans TaxID=1765967 RepID=A0A1P8UDF4_9GAMM|nr:DUF1028 domain-containing protein [Acidihalobacter ferrooxydans]APZ41799.1 hypothetical protein BW247_00725 [Acidihalobacter ferrooxydans]